MGDIIWIVLLLVMAWFLFARPRDDSEDDSGNGPDARPGPPRRDGRPSPSDLRPPSRYQAPPSQPSASAGPKAPPTEDPDPTPREASDAYRRAQSMWDSLRSTPRPAQGSGAPSPSGRANGRTAFDQQEFLQGARMVYARIQDSWDARDMADIREFVDEQVLTNLQDLAAKDPTPSRTTILTLDAEFLDLDKSGEREVASVRFTVRMAKGDAPPYTIKEIWHFGRDVAADSASAGMWKVVGISQID